MHEKYTPFLLATIHRDIYMMKTNISLYSSELHHWLTKKSLDLTLNALLGLSCVLNNIVVWNYLILNLIEPINKWVFKTKVTVDQFYSHFTNTISTLLATKDKLV